MGLGRLALQNVLPAFANCKHARPVALVSGGPQKMSAVAQQYGIAADACYSYQAFDKLLPNRAVDVVYDVSRIVCTMTPFCEAQRLASTFSAKNRWQPRHTKRNQ